ncbi:T9SS type B sorting domain-containing protein [Flavobacterium davisii]|uniref:T9SS type B sorting domain-containing protein n=1 Tax=Flavobacterium columnare TaxID=996 RepID=A0A8G0KXE2_9FLAO|nr:T9SS type B sorting domain-containing protein [Flavobacterium davisii]
MKEIEIFDRYGKLLKQLNPNQAWDGTYLDNNLPADDYWFTIKLYNNNTIKNHFSLKR